MNPAAAFSEYPGDVLAEEAITVADSAIGLTAATYGTASPMTWARIVNGAQPIRLKFTADPTDTVGEYIAAYDTRIIADTNNIRKARFIRATGTSSVIAVQYGRY